MRRLLHNLLEETARNHPQREAVVWGEKILLYHELERQSAALANLLLGHGVGRGDRVGIYLDKSPEAVVSVFGILRAGAAYVPIDPLAPARRAAFIVEDCDVGGLVTSPDKAEELAACLSPTFTLRSLVLTSGSRGVRLPRCSNEASAWAPDAWSGTHEAARKEPGEADPAYILYTSGSTGRPKGVVVSHRASRVFVDWAVERFELTFQDRLSNHAPLHFDLSVFDIFASVAVGAAVLPVPSHLSAFPRELADFIEGEGITVWYSVPSVLTRLVLYGAAERHRFRNLRRIIFAGETFPVKHLTRLQGFIPEAQYHNLYGPTETNVCTAYRVPPPGPGDGKVLPIGKACAYADVFLWTKAGRTAARGEVGEILVGGDSLMEGYWRAPDQTASALVPDPRPKGESSPRRVYRTGDLALENADGNLVFLGRRDQMIKSRGYRIEPGEIESVLLEHPHVVEAVVLAVADEEIGSSLRAVVVPKAGSGIGEGDLKSHCAHFLPSYMIPVAVDFTDGLPRTSTGKIDRRGLTERYESKTRHE